MMTAKEDIRRRIELERADATRKALEMVIQALQNDPAKSESYRKVKKRCVGVVEKLRAKF